MTVLQGMDPTALRLCQRVLRESGFIEVEVTKRSGDGGIDGYGTIRIGETVALAYIDQSRSLDPQKSIWQEISGGADLLKIGNREVNSRAYVARFNFSGTCGLPRPFL